MKFTTANAWHLLHVVHRGFSVGERLAANYLVNRSSFNKWEFDEAESCWVYPMHLQSAQQMAIDLEVCRNTVGGWMNTLCDDTTRGFHLEKVADTGRGPKYLMYLKVPKNHAPQQTEDVKNHAPDAQKLSSRCSETMQQVPKNPAHINTTNSNNPPPMEEGRKRDEFRFRPEDPDDMQYIPAAQLEAYRNHPSDQFRLDVEPHPDCERTLVWLFRALNGRMGLGPVSERNPYSRTEWLTDAECLRLLDFRDKQGLTEEQERQVVVQVIQEFRAMRASMSTGGLGWNSTTGKIWSIIEKKAMEGNNK